MKKVKRIFIIIIALIFCVVYILAVRSVSSFPLYKTPLEWCVLDVLHNEPYADGETVDGWKYEKINITYEEGCYNEYCYVVTVIYEVDDGIRFDYWICGIETQRKCIHNMFDYFKDKSSDNAQICPDHISAIDCDWFKTEIAVDNYDDYDWGDDLEYEE